MKVLIKALLNFGQKKGKLRQTTQPSSKIFWNPIMRPMNKQVRDVDCLMNTSHVSKQSTFI